jgi:hypothetical protein
MRRREFLLGSISVLPFGLLTAGCATATSTTEQANGVDEDFLREFMAEEADGAFEMTAQVQKTLTTREWKSLNTVGSQWNWWDTPKDERPAVSWPEPALAPDYAPFIGLGAPADEFAVSHETLEWLAERNHFDLGDDAMIVIGFRGAQLPDGEADSGWQEVVKAALDVPNHIDPKCLIGAWDRTGKRVRLFHGSTVPEVSYMWAQCRLDSGANLMPTGLYVYEVGVHPKHSKRTPQIGALRLAGYGFNADGPSAPVIYTLRTLDNLTYSVGDGAEVWDRCAPGNNIHAAVFGGPGDRYLVGAGGQNFSSAGCQTIPGGYELYQGDDGMRWYSKEPIGAWRNFREALGLAVSPEIVEGRTCSDDGKRFRYMLLTGWDASFASSPSEQVLTEYFPFRPGSSGPEVEKLQKTAYSKPDGWLGAGTADAVVYLKKTGLGIAETPVTMNLASLEKPLLPAESGDSIVEEERVLDGARLERNEPAEDRAVEAEGSA